MYCRLNSTYSNETLFASGYLLLNLDLLGLGTCLSNSAVLMECLHSGFLVNHLCLYFLRDVSAVWPDQNLESGLSGGTCCVLLRGGITEPSSAPRGASG